VLLTNGQTYTLFARSASGNVASAWDSQTFVAALDAPNAPTLTATADATNARVTLAIGWTGSDTPPVTGYIIERSEDAGVTWQKVRNGYRQSATALAGTSATVQDYEAPFNKVLRYRAQTFGGASGGYVRSASTQAATQPTVAVDVVWLVSLDDTSLRMHALEQDVYLDMTRRKRRAFYEPLGRELPVGFRSPGKGNRFTMNFLSVNQTQIDAIEAILDNDSPILVRTSRRAYYVDVETDYNVRDGLWDDLHNRPHIGQYAVPFREITTPDVEPI